MRNAVNTMKLIALFTVLANLFGCTPLKPEILDGPGMEYVDSNYRTEYANTLPFDDIDSYPYWAVVFLGVVAEGEENRAHYIEKLFSELPKKSLDKIKHYDFEGDEWYLIIPRYGDENDIVSLCGDEKEKYIKNGEAFTVKCGRNIKIVCYSRGEHEFSPQTDENERLICTEDVWDITEYNQ